MKRSRASFKNRVEVKYTQPVSTVSEYRVGVLDVTKSDGSYLVGWDRWISMMPPVLYSNSFIGSTPKFNQQYGSTPFLDNLTFEESVFTPGPHTPAHITSANCGIAQGTGTHNRIGRQVNVLKDKWRFVFSIPNKDPATGKAYGSGLGTRTIKCRMMCIYRNRISDTSRTYLTPFEIFDDSENMHSTLKADSADYTVVFDKRFSLGSIPGLHTDLTTPSTPAWTDTQYIFYHDKANTGGPLEQYVKFSSKPYSLQWADENTTGRFQPYTEYDEEVVNQKYHGGPAPTKSPTAPGNSLQNGVTAGVFQWFFFFEDENADTIITDTAIPNPVQRIHPYHGIRMQIERVTKFTDP